MNREILFKGKRVDNGEWKEGYLFDNGYSTNKRMFVGGLVIVDYEGTACDEYEINGIDFEEVDPKTICQYKGLKDKNGNKIWENDIVKLHGLYGNEVGVVEYLCYAFRVRNSAYGSIRLCGEVIGNIFDNPELLKGSEENG